MPEVGQKQPPEIELRADRVESFIKAFDPPQDVLDAWRQVRSSAMALHHRRDALARQASEVGADYGWVGREVVVEARVRGRRFDARYRVHGFRPGSKYCVELRSRRGKASYITLDHAKDLLGVTEVAPGGRAMQFGED